MNYQFRLPAKILGPEKILGVTAKTVNRALEAETLGADYLGTGAIFPTTTKRKCTHYPDFNLENNLPNGRHSSSCYRRLTSENIDQLIGTGIAGVAVVRDLMQAEDIEAKTQAFLTKLDDIVS